MKSLLTIILVLPLTVFGQSHIDIASLDKNSVSTSPLNYLLGNSYEKFFFYNRIIKKSDSKYLSLKIGAEVKNRNWVAPELKTSDRINSGSYSISLGLDQHIRKKHFFLFYGIETCISRVTVAGNQETNGTRVNSSVFDITNYTFVSALDSNEEEGRSPLFKTNRVSVGRLIGNFGIKYFFTEWLSIKATSAFGFLHSRTKFYFEDEPDVSLPFTVNIYEIAPIRNIEIEYYF